MLTNLVNMTEIDYHSRKELGSSGIKTILQSPAHYYAKYLDPNKPADKDTPALRFGRLFHKILLEPTEFKKNIRIKPDADGRTVAGKKTLAEFHESCTHESIIVTEDEITKLTRMAEQVLKHPILPKLLEKGVAERSGFVEMEGVDCKFRPDFLTEDLLMIDIKTCEDARPESFRKTIENYQYYIQMAFYKDGFEKLHNMKLQGCLWVAIEKEYPHGLKIIPMGSDYYYGGQQEYRKALEIYKKCKEKNEWPGYDPRIEEITPNPWFFWQYE